MERFNLSDLQLITKEEDLLGNFTSVKGEYNVPGIEKTGFYKENGCILGAKNEEDLREFLSSKILDKIGLPHADIILAKDEQGNNGCLSMNILKKNEHFVEP